MDTATSGDHDRGCRRDIGTAVRDLDGVTERAVYETAAETVATSSVPEEYDRRVFELVGLDCRVCAGFAEVAIQRLDAVSNATSSHTHGTLRVDFDPERLGEDDLRAELAALGYPVDTTDEAFENRRSAQWAEARFAAGIMAGLMALVPYAAVIYPTRFAFWPYSPEVVALLESALTSVFATHFYANLAMLAAVVLLFTGKPILDDAVAGLREGSPNRSLVIASLAVGIYLYSTLGAFWLVGAGGVYYDVVIALVVGATVLRGARADDAEDDTPSETPDSATAKSATDRR